jgi:hypothetical protein
MAIMALKRVVVIKGISIHISTSPSSYPGDVGRHNSCAIKSQEFCCASKTSEKLIVPFDRTNDVGS